MPPSAHGPAPTTHTRRPAGPAVGGRLLVCAAALAAATGCNALALPAPPPVEFTAFAAENVAGLSAHRIGGDLTGDGLRVRASVPEIPDAQPLTERLTEIVEREADDFRNAYSDAERLEVDWALTAAGQGVIGVRLIRTEVDHRGRHDAYSTYYYDTRTGRTAYSTELLAGNAELRELNRLAAAELKGSPADGADLYPGFRLYDSIGFNDDGDLVVEFDAGRAAPVGEGRIAAVVPSGDARPLLSGLGERVRAASLMEPRAFSVDSAPQGPAEGTPRIPGSRPGGTGDHQCGAETTCVALTFDDGPSEHTGAVLDLLAEHEAKATFFVTGRAVRNRPALLGRAWAQGHGIGSHGESHTSFPELSRAELDAELTTTDALIRRELGTHVGIVRPPFGDTDTAAGEVAAEHNQAQIVWDTDSEDWTGIPAEEIAANVTARTPPNGMVLMHDTEETTIAALPEILEHFHEQGYTLVTVPDLLGETEPGGLYYSMDPAANETCIALDGCPS